MLLTSTSTQRTLPFLPKSKDKGKGVDTGMRQTTLDGFAGIYNASTQRDRLREIVMENLGRLRCRISDVLLTAGLGAVIKLNSDVVKLFRRLNVVYFRRSVSVILLSGLVVDTLNVQHAILPDTNDSRHSRQSQEAQVRNV